MKPPCTLVAPGIGLDLPIVSLPSRQYGVGSSSSCVRRALCKGQGLTAFFARMRTPCTVPWWKLNFYPSIGDATPPSHHQNVRSALPWQSRTLDYPFHPVPCSPEEPLLLTVNSILSHRSIYLSLVARLSYQTAPSRKKVRGGAGSSLPRQSHANQTIKVKHRKYGISFLAKAKPKEPFSDRRA